MFCPTCRDEFRAGFTRCERCQVDLVDDLSQLESAQSRTKTPPPQAPVVMADYCGFFSMQEAAQARELLRRERILTEIVLREPPDPDWDAPPQDEFWLRVDASRAQEVQKLMGMLGQEYEKLAATGGEPIGDVYGNFPELDWDVLVKQFLGTKRI